MKRAFDIVVGLLAVVILSPVMLGIALAIRLKSRAPALFKQRRAGRRGRPFNMLKFRTMRPDVAPYGPSPRAGDDARLTRFGRVLREMSLDELPQLFNVLAGQMSLVGPRPLYERQAAKWSERQRRRLEVRPGITGYAQAYGRAGLTHEEKIELDLYYVDKRSLRLDLKIIIRTVANVFTGGGEVYEQRYSRDELREADADAEDRAGGSQDAQT